MLNKIKLLDGAMGSELIKRGLIPHEYTWTSNANIEVQEMVYDIHAEYVESGSHYLTTNTFRSTPRSYAKLGLSIGNASIIAKKSLENAVKIAKKASSNKCKILGSIAPLEDCYKPELFPGRKIALSEFNTIGSWFYESDIAPFRDGISRLYRSNF